MMVSSTLVTREQLQRLPCDAGHSNVGYRSFLLTGRTWATESYPAFSSPSSRPAQTSLRGADPPGDRITLTGRLTGTLTLLSEITA
jgi:hypothetical protein